MASIEIELTQTDDGLIAAPIGRPGDTVTWIFTGNLVGRNLEVRRKDALPVPAFPKPAQEREASRPPAPAGQTVLAFEYIVVDRDDHDAPLPWARGQNGGCVKFPDPPGN